jgi:hypothetical protein
VLVTVTRIADSVCLVLILDGISADRRLAILVRPSSRRTDLLLALIFSPAPGSLTTPPTHVIPPDHPAKRLVTDLGKR